MQIELTSQLQYNYFYTQTNRYFAECNFGIREIDFEYNGIATSKLEYGIFKVNLYKNNNYATKLNATIKINNKSYVYILEKNPFDSSFMCDIKKSYGDNDIIEIYIENIDDCFNEFISKSKDWSVNYNYILKKGFKSLKHFIKNNKNCECYLTIIYNKYNQQTSYYWMFKALSNNGESKIVIFDINGDIVLKS